MHFILILGQVVSGYRVRDGKWTLIGRQSPQLPQVILLLNLFIVKNKELVFQVWEEKKVTEVWNSLTKRSEQDWSQFKTVQRIVKYSVNQEIWGWYKKVAWTKTVPIDLGKLQTSMRGWMTHCYLYSYNLWIMAHILVEWNILWYAPLGRLFPSFLTSIFLSSYSGWKYDMVKTAIEHLALNTKSSLLSL